MLVSFAMAASLLGTQPTQQLSALVIMQAVQESVRAQLIQVGSHPSIEVTGRMPDQALPPGNVTIEVSPVNGRLPRPRLGVPVRLLLDGRLARSLTVWVELHERRTVPVYVQDHAVGETADAFPLQSAVVDMVCCAGTVLGSVEDLAHQRFAHSVRAGQPVMREDLEQAPAVQAHKPVDIELRRGAVRLHTPGIALADGYPGERVAVRPANSESAVITRVLGPRQVRVE